MSSAYRLGQGTGDAGVGIVFSSAGLGLADVGEGVVERRW